MSKITQTNQASTPDTPDSGKTATFIDSTTKKLATVDDVGTKVDYLGTVGLSPGTNALVKFNASGLLVDTGLIVDSSDNLTGLADLTSTGDITAANFVTAGLVDGRDVSVDGTKLDGVEALADVTDSSNVASAGAVMDTDFSASDGSMIKTGAGAYSLLKLNLSAVTAPGVGDDSNDGYGAGSIWIDTVGGNSYTCIDPSVGAAVWASGGLSEVGFGDLDTDMSTAQGIFDGMYLDSPVVDVTSDGVTITASIEASGGGDLRVVFMSEVYLWDCTPTCTISLTAGSDTSPQINYIYLLESTKTLTVSTSGWPASGQYAPVATVLCQSAASLQTDGPYKVHAWTDHARGATNNGHLAHLNEWIRNQHATHLSGVDQTLTITINGGAPDNVIFTSAAGSVLQLHEHSFPAFSGTPDVYVINDSTTPYTKVTDLNALLTDSLGVSMSGTRFSLVIWGVVSEDNSDCKLFCNLPSGTYASDASVIADSSNYADFTIPSEFKGVGFLISELKLRHRTNNSGTWTSIQEIDLRGLYPAISAGGGAASSSEFSDNVFRINNVSDPTKQLAFDASAITTATTRTIDLPDADLSLYPVAYHTVSSISFANKPSDTVTQFLFVPPGFRLTSLTLRHEDGNGTPAVPTAGTLTVEHDDDGTTTNQLSAASIDLTSLTSEGTVLSVTTTADSGDGTNLTGTAANRDYVVGDQLRVSAVNLACNAEAELYFWATFEVTP